MKLPGLADTLRRLAEAGFSDFYTGTIAARLDEDVRTAGGFLRRSDLARVPVSVLDTAPVRGTYRGLTALSVPSPAGGSVFVMALQILDEFPAATLAAPGLARGQAIVEAVRLARAEAMARAGSRTSRKDRSCRSGSRSRGRPDRRSGFVRGARSRATSCGAREGRGPPIAGRPRSRSSTRRGTPSR